MRWCIYGASIDKISELCLLYLNHGTEWVRLKYWTIRNEMVLIIHILVRDWSLRKKLERLRVLLTQAFGDCKTVHVRALTTLGRGQEAAEHLGWRRVARTTGSNQVLF